LSGKLTEEDNQDEDEKDEKPVHDQVEGIILILFEKLFESFHVLSCSSTAKVRNLRQRQKERPGSFSQKSF
jgi:hypothetical protein